MFSTSHRRFVFGQHSGLGPNQRSNLDNNAINLSTSFFSFRLDHTEYTCLKALVLFQPDLPGLQHQLQIEVLQDQTHIMLQVHCNKNPIYVFLFWEFYGLSPNFHSYMCLWAIYIFPGSIHIFSCRRIGRSIVGIYNSLTDTWMWKFGLWPRSSFFGNICFLFSALGSVQCRISHISPDMDGTETSKLSVYG